jgi:hypothetical protein
MAEEDKIPPNEKSDKDLSKYFYYENGLMVFTAEYHLLRGYCCERGCRHCPFGFKMKGNPKQ